MYERGSQEGNGGSRAKLEEYKSPPKNPLLELIILIILIIFCFIIIFFGKLLNFYPANTVSSIQKLAGSSKCRSRTFSLPSFSLRPLPL
jgi:hypothetical protein